MAWEHFEDMNKGTAIGLADGQIRTLQYRYGAVSTGRQRVHAGYFVEISAGDQVRVMGRDQYGLVTALRSAADQLEAEGVTLKAAGTSPEFYETGLSFNSGRGYLGKGPAVSMMEPHS